MKVLIDARMIHGHHGIARYTRNLITGLSHKNLDLALLVTKDSAKALKNVQIKEKILCRIPFAHPLEIAELSYKTRFINYDVAHFPSFAVPALNTKRTVVTIHDLIHLHHPTVPLTLYYKGFLQPRLKTVEMIIAVSRWGKRELQNLLGIDHSKIIVIRNGLEPEFFKQPSKASEKPTLVCLTNLKKHKNASALLRACRKLWEQDFEFKLVLSLGGKDIPQEWKLSPFEISNIKLLKNVSDKEISDAIGSCWALVSPSIMEGFDYPVAEALAQQKPVILSNGSAHDEFEGKSAIFYGDPKDINSLAAAIKVILKKSAVFTSGHNVSSVEEMINLTLKVYEKVSG